MKIALLVWELNITGGTQRQALELAVALQNKGHKVDVYCSTYDKKHCYEKLCDKLRIFPVETPFQTKQLTTPATKIGKVLALYRNTIISLFTIDPQIWALSTLMEKHGPISSYDVINIHDYQVYRVARITKHPRIIWMMNDIQRFPIKNKNIIHEKIYNTLQHILAWLETRNITKIAVLDKRNLALCKKAFRRDAVVVRSGIDLSMFPSVPAKDFKKPVWKIFASSIFFPYRRFEDLVDAVEILTRKGITNIAVVINGIPNRAYDYYLSIEKRVRDKKLQPYISIQTGMPENELRSQYLSTDIFVFPNHNQTWGLAVFEAMLAGCACIVSRTSGAHEVLTDKENALLVDPFSPEQIASAIETFIHDPEYAKNIAQQGQTFVHKNLSWEKYAEQMEHLFEHEI